VAAAKAAYRAGHRRVFRPWIPEPGLWLRFGWGEGPRIRGRRTSLWCAWLAWSRFRVVILAFDKTLPTVVACLDATLRRIGGVSTHTLTDNEKTVTVEHIARVPVRNQQIVEVGRHYGADHPHLRAGAMAALGDRVPATEPPRRGVVSRTSWQTADSRISSMLRES
jgi:hypothetical protein